MSDHSMLPDGEQNRNSRCGASDPIDFADLAARARGDARLWRHISAFNAGFSIMNSLGVLDPERHSGIPPSVNVLFAVGAMAVAVHTGIQATADGSKAAALEVAALQQNADPSS